MFGRLRWPPSPSRGATRALEVGSARITDLVGQERPDLLRPAGLSYASATASSLPAVELSRVASLSLSDSPSSPAAGAPHGRDGVEERQRECGGARRKRSGRARLLLLPELVLPRHSSPDLVEERQMAAIGSRAVAMTAVVVMGRMPATATQDAAKEQTKHRLI